MTETNPRDKHGVFYGWYALTGVMLVIFTVGGVFVQCFSVLLPVITTEFDWSRGVVAGALSAGIIALGLPSPFYGGIVTRFGPRKTLIFGNLLAGLGIAGVFFVQEIWHLYVLYIIVGMGGGTGGYISCTTVINNWFIKRRSLVLGIFIASSGLAGLAFPPLTTGLIAVVGWRLTWLILAGIIIFIAVLLGSVVLVRNRPEDTGQMPDGLSDVSYADMVPEEPASSRVETWKVTQAFRSATPWLIGGFTAANAFTMGAMMTHQIAYVQDIGYNPMTAATTLSFMSVFSLIGSLGFGALALRFNPRYLASAGFVIQLLGLIILITTRELGFIYVYAAFQGMTNGALLTAMPTLVGAYYPRHRYARVLGVILPFQVVANAAAATIGGAIYDATLSYTPAFITAAAFSLLGVFFAFNARKPRTA